MNHTFRERLEPLMPDTAMWEGRSLSIGRVPLEDLADRYGTPLYVYDLATLRRAAEDVVTAFQPLGARLSFAAKACALVGVLATLRREGLNLDVVSSGEIEAGLRAGFSPRQMHLHGNCKSDLDLTLALRLGVHAIVADSCDELRQIDALAGDTVPVWLRLAPALTAETHPHLQTSGGSKFGIEPGRALNAAVRLIRSSRHLSLCGLHAHLGSQIADAALIADAGGVLAGEAESLRRHGMPIQMISVGGGWAVPYVPSDAALLPATVAAALSDVAREHPRMEIAVEPGRALVARAAVALYRVGAVKRAGERTIVAVDGGMGDNPRPALYDSRYTVVPVKAVSGPWSRPTDVVGRYCESGDILARDVLLPDLEAGDLICLPVAGAYQLSMASAYNLIPPPAAVMVGDSKIQPLVRRATIEDLLARDLWPSVASDMR